jgi:STE24 endopeptidase
LKQGLITLQKENKGTPLPDPWYSAYHHSHPPLLQRLRAIDQVKVAEGKKVK